MMKKLLSVAFLLLLVASSSSAQTIDFPGVSPAQRKQLTTAKRHTPVPLPTWLPAGFTVERIQMKLGPRVEIQYRELVIIYSRKLPKGKVQRFSLEAGFDGIGGLPYDVTHTLTTPVGTIELMYEPTDLDDSSKKIRNFAITEWFNVGKTPYHYLGRHGDPEDKDPNLVVISLADTQKILKSLRRL